MIFLVCFLLVGCVFMYWIGHHDGVEETRQICYPEIQKLKDQIDVEPKNPDRNGMYDDFEIHEMEWIGVDEHRFLYVIAKNSEKRHVFCAHMCDWCTDRCMCFENAWHPDGKIGFQCRFFPFRYVAKKSLRHVSNEVNK